MKRKYGIYIFLIFIILLVVSWFVSRDFGVELDIDSEEVENLYSLLDTRKVTDKTYQVGLYYKNNNFYSNRLINYDKLRDGARLYFAYHITEDLDVSNPSTCEELESYLYNGEDLSVNCFIQNDTILLKHATYIMAWNFYKISKDTLQKAYQKMYGYNKEMVLKQFDIDGLASSCAYSEKNEDFICFIDKNKEDEDYLYALTRISKSIKYSNKIEIYDQYIYVYREHLGKTLKLFKTSSKANLLGKVDINEEISDEYFNQGCLYKHIFKKDIKGNYYWYSSEIVE